MTRSNDFVNSQYLRGFDHQPTNNHRHIYLYDYKSVMITTRQYMDATGRKVPDTGYDLHITLFSHSQTDSAAGPRHRFLSISLEHCEHWFRSLMTFPNSLANSQLRGCHMAASLEPSVPWGITSQGQDTLPSQSQRRECNHPITPKI
jgi:hypothetical protein